MGAITITPGGTVYVDANIVIYSVETHATFWPLLKPLWQAAWANQVQFVTSELTYLETLVVPIRNGDMTLISGFEEVLASSEFTIQPIARNVLREAAQLRAAISGIRTPDAIHAATAMLNPVSMFLTNDPSFRRITDLPVIVLSDLLTT